MPTIPLNDLGKGVNKDLLPAELGAGVWSDAENFRFRNGFAEKFEGLVNKYTPTGTVVWLANYASPAKRWVIEGTSSTPKVYAFDGTNRFEITRYTDGVGIASITFVGTTATLNTDAAHGRTTGQQVTVYGASPSQYNGTFTITVVDPDTFTYTMAGTPATNATAVGAYSYDVTSNFSGNSGTERPTASSLGGIFIYNHPTDGLYYWNGDTATRLRKFPRSYKADSARVFKNFIVQVAPTMGGVKYPHRVIWSASAEGGSIPSSFDSSSTNDAGFVDLAESVGFCVDSLTLGDANIIYKQDARVSMTFIGGNDVFRFQWLPGEEGLFERDCFADTPVGHVFFTQSLDVMIHQGGEAQSLSEGIIGNWIASNIDTSQANIRNECYMAINPPKDEVWFAFEIVNASLTNFPNVFAVWNWVSKSWSIFRFRVPADPTQDYQIPFAVHGLWPTSITEKSRMLTANSSLVGLVDSAANGNFIGGVVTGTLERTGLHFDNRNQFKTLQRSRWNIDGTAGNTATISHGSSKTADGTVTYASGATYTIGTTDYVDARATSGRFCAIKLVTTAAAPFSVRSADLDVTTGGKR